MILLKFGGTSLGNVDCINRVIAIIAKRRHEAELAVVVSAIGDTTEKMIEMTRLAAKGDEDYTRLYRDLKDVHIDMVQQLISCDAAIRLQLDAWLAELEDFLRGISLVRDCSNKLTDMVLSFGEKMSALILASALQARGVSAEYLDAGRVLKTDDRFGEANVRYDETRREIGEHFHGRTAIQVITGFIGSNEKNETTTLGRGGSDYSAAIFGEALGCSEIQIWTDVNGVMTADPKIVPEAFPIKRLGYHEATEMAYYGSKVIHPSAVQRASAAGIPITIRNTFDEKFAGTRICNGANTTAEEVHGISSFPDVSVLSIRGNGEVGLANLASRLFAAMARGNVEAIFSRLSFSRNLLSVAVASHSVALAAKCVQQEFGMDVSANHSTRFDVQDHIAGIAVTNRLEARSAIAARIFQALDENRIEVIELHQNCADISTLVLVRRKDKAAALNAIHQVLCHGFERTLNLFLLGTGGVGSKLIEQIAGRVSAIKEQRGIEIKMNAIANSKRMIFDQKGVPMDNWRALLKNAEESSDLDRFVENAQAHYSKNKVVVDCTASDSVAARYDGILQSGITIVTANKLAASGDYQQYQRLKHLARERRAKYFYETNVGASLPIISTIRDMVLCGDEILKIEAVVSGTVSFLFNAFDGTKPFSEIVRAAHTQGYTEPDPREDLTGQDVARKLIIMAREAGFGLELTDVAVESLLPGECENGPSSEEFFERLSQSDAYFESRRSEADRKGKVLRYIASLERNEAKVALQEVGMEHPFSLLNGNENIVVLKTRRYCESPLIIRGPGAGTDVTAAGLFADILRTID